ncbi:hypothetical protein Tco_1379840, partial [Tanacetum coccineum]
MIRPCTSVSADPIKDKASEEPTHIYKIRTLTFIRSPNVLKGNDDEKTNKNDQIELVLRKSIRDDIMEMNM